MVQLLPQCEAKILLNYVYTVALDLTIFKIWTQLWISCVINKSI
jgi:hypothetical protein